MREVTLGDVDGLAQLHQESFPKGWDAAQFTELLGSGVRGWLIAGSAFILIRTAADEAEIITLATTPSARRQGHAESLLKHAISILCCTTTNRFFLEVRDGNEAGAALYLKHGFTQIATRSRYYGMPDGTRKDALVMELALG
ncbi:MAG: GNAT family N-acetyltransferase [Rickettsiales bacterium]|nr:GNAT family N-acetyltransferase [Rickettsiales bacterium]